MKDREEWIKMLKERMINLDGTPNMDIFRILGRTPFNKDDHAADDDFRVTHQTIDSDGLYRQNFAIKEFARTLHDTILLHDINQKVEPQVALKPAIKKSFYVKELKLLNPDYVDPDDEQKKNTEASQALVSYLDSYRQNPNFLEDLNPAVQAAKRQVDRKLPLPPYAKQQIIN